MNGRLSCIKFPFDRRDECVSWEGLWLAQGPAVTTEEQLKPEDGWNSKRFTRPRPNGVLNACVCVFVGGGIIS